jgi:predicted alpha/beta-hydrolase family hydrolase
MTSASPVELLRDGPVGASARLVLAHGAGLPMDAPFMTALAERIGAAGVEVVRFEFPYMRVRRATGRKRAPNTERVLLESWREVIGVLGGPSELVIGGKSLGGRMASMVADEVGARGLVVFGYPFHAPATPGRLRTAHLETLRTPALICQGERDRFGSRAELEGEAGRYALSEAIALRWLGDGDHSFVPRKSSGRTLEQNLDEAAATAVTFIEGLPRA